MTSNKLYERSREDFIEECIRADIFAKKSRNFTFHPYLAIKEKYPYSTLTLQEQFHNSVLKLKNQWSDKLAEQLFWEMEILKLRSFACNETDLTDVHVSSNFEDDLYLIDDKIVVMRPVYKATSPESWAYVVIHEIGHHVICRGRTFSSGRRVNDRAFFSDASKRNSKTFHMSLLETEVLAWHEGIKLAEHAGVHMVDKNIDRIKTNCLISYTTLE